MVGRVRAQLPLHDFSVSFPDKCWYDKFLAVVRGMKIPANLIILAVVKAGMPNSSFFVLHCVTQILLAGHVFIKIQGSVATSHTLFSVKNLWVFCLLSHISFWYSLRGFSPAIVKSLLVLTTSSFCFYYYSVFHGLQQRMIVICLSNLRGAEPRQLAFSSALGITLGVFPICGMC